MIIFEIDMSIKKAVLQKRVGSNNNHQNLRGNMSPLLPSVYLGVKVAPQCCRRRHFDVGHENWLQLGNTAPVRSHRQRRAAPRRDRQRPAANVSTGAGAATVSAGSTMGHKERSFSNDGGFDSGHDGTHWP
jgi:hypothetical protein